MHGQNVSFRFGGPITPMVKKLMIINGAIFLLQQFVNLFSPGAMESLFGLNHIGLIHEFRIWQLFTYMFLHGGWLHIIFNLLALWMFAGELENLWGSKLFLRYYLYGGIGAGLFISIMNYIIFNKYMANPTTIGASGALYAILLAYGMIWPNREVLLYFLFPVKMKYLVLIFGLMEFFGTLSSIGGQGGNISHIGHLGGLISGYLFIMYKRRGKIVRPVSPTSKKENLLGRLMKKIRLTKKRKEIDTRIKAKKIIDDLLEKIARSGMSSLSPEEKRQLEWARRHYYPERNDTVH